MNFFKLIPAFLVQSNWYEGEVREQQISQLHSSTRLELLITGLQENARPVLLTVLIFTAAFIGAIWLTRKRMKKIEKSVANRRGRIADHGHRNWDDVFERAKHIRDLEKTDPEQAAKEKNLLNDHLGSLFEAQKELDANKVKTQTTGQSPLERIIQTAEQKAPVIESENKAKRPQLRILKGDHSQDQD